MKALAIGVSLSILLIFGLFPPIHWTVAGPTLLAVGGAGLLVLGAFAVRDPLELMLLLFPFLFLKAKTVLALIWLLGTIPLVLAHASRTGKPGPQLSHKLGAAMLVVLTFAVLGWTRSYDPLQGFMWLIGTYVVPFSLFALVVKSPDDWNLARRLPRLFSWAFAGLGILGLGYKILHPEAERVAGFLQMSPTMVAYACAATVPLALHFFDESKGRARETVVLGLILLAMLLTNTRMAILMTAVAFAFDWRRIRGALAVWMGVGAAGLLVAAPLLFTRFHEMAGQQYDYSTGARLVAWASGIKLLMASPWTGLGLANFSDAYLAVTQFPLIRLYHAHNTVLQTASDLGLPGMFAFLGLLGWLLFSRRPRTSLQRALRLGLVIFLMAGMTDYIFFLVEWGWWFWVLLGCMWRLHEDEARAGASVPEGIPTPDSALPYSL